MPNLSGAFTGTAAMQSAVALKDEAGHELNIVQIAGVQRSPDPKWDGARITYWGVADLVAGNGPQRGYFLNELKDGDTNHGAFEGKVTTAAGMVTIEGTWRFTGGTGGLSGISGGGTYQGRMTSPTEAETSWEGSYQTP